MNKTDHSGDSPPSMQAMVIDLTTFVRWLKIFATLNWVAYWMGCIFGVGLLIHFAAVNGAALFDHSDGSSLSSGEIAELAGVHVLADSPAVALLQILVTVYGFLVAIQFKTSIGNFRSPLVKLFVPRFQEEWSLERIFYPHRAFGFVCIAGGFAAVAMLAHHRLLIAISVTDAVVFFLIALCVARLRVTRVMRSHGKELCQFIGVTEKLRRRAPAAPPRAFWRGFRIIAFSFSGLMLTLYFVDDVFSFIDQIFHTDIAHSQAGGTSVRTSMALPMLQARYYFQPNYAAVRSADGRPVVLFLRSFTIDMGWKNFWVRIRPLRETLEQRLARYFNAVGPFVGVGSDDDRGIVGAIRTVQPNSGWQDYVLEQMRSSAGIVMIPGATHSVEWEMRKIAQLGLLSKTVFVLPALSWFAGKEKRQVVGTLLAQLQTDTPAAAWTGTAGRIKPRRIRALALDRSGQPVLVTSRSGDLFSAELAAITAHFWQNRTNLDAYALPSPDPYVPRPQRMLARCLDIVLAAAMCIPIAVLLSPYETQMASGYPLVLTSLCVLTALAYYVMFVGAFGVTLGKGMMGMRVRRPDGLRVGYTAAFKRVFLILLDMHFPGTREAETHTIVARASPGWWKRPLFILTWCAAVGLSVLSGTVRRPQQAPAATTSTPAPAPGDVLQGRAAVQNAGRSLRV